jgi:hypothetical protein
MPQSFKKWIVRKVIGDLMADSTVEAAAELINPLVVRNIIHMTVHELQQVESFPLILQNRELNNLSI